MGTVVTITSGKGGTGKTTVTASISSQLAKLGKRVLCIDMDCAMRNLDLALGMSDRALMDFTDVINGHCTLEQAAIPHPSNSCLFFLAAPAYTPIEQVTEDQMHWLMQQAAAHFDYIMLDSPAGLGHGWRLSVCAAHLILVVTTTDPFALRDAERVSMELSGLKADNRLIVNRVHAKLLRKMHVTIDDAIDQTGLPLLGIIPEDPWIQVAAGQGAFPAIAFLSRAGIACYNIAKRLIGETVPLIRI